MKIAVRAATLLICAVLAVGVSLTTASVPFENSLLFG